MKREKKKLIESPMSDINSTKIQIILLNKYTNSMINYLAIEK